MASSENNYSVEHVEGNTDVPRLTNPALRGSVRSSDPDGSHTDRWFSGLNGTSLNLDVTPVGSLTINFASDNLADALSTINAESPANLAATSEDGYVRIRNLNSGNKNSIKVTGGDAAPILGFVVDPEPGSVSYAGELDLSASGRTDDQNNPQGTGLVAANEDLKSSSINRAVLAGTLGLFRLLKELDLEVPVVKTINATVSTHGGSGKQVVIITDADLRVPISGFGISGSTPGANEIDSIAMLLDDNDEPIFDIDEATPYARVVDVYYNDGTNPAADNTSSFGSWGTIDGKSIFGSSVPNKDKHASTSITAIRGNVIEVSGATFSTNHVQPGDTAVIENATNNSPFNHNGEFVVIEVLDEERIAVRPKSQFEGTFISSDKPTGLNAETSGGAVYGDVRIVIGDYVSAADGLMFEVPSWVSNGSSYRLRVLCGQKLSNMDLGAIAKTLYVSPGSIVQALRDHISQGTAGWRHTASQIDAPGVAGSPDSLTAGTVEDQLSEILTHINNLIAGQVSYAGGIAWVDGTTNPATDLESQVDKILTDLAGAGNDGSAKIRALAAGDLSAGSIRDQLNQLDVEWLKLDRANSITADQTFDNATLHVGDNNADDKAAIDSTGLPSGSRKLLWEFGDTTNGKTRFYLLNGGFEITHNASWNEGTFNWSRDNNIAAGIISIEYSTIKIGHSDVSEGDPFSGFAPAWQSINKNESVDIISALSRLRYKTVFGESIDDNAEEATVPRIEIPTFSGGGADEKTLLLEAGDGSQFWRLYADKGGASAENLWITYNARWADDGGTYRWHQEDAADRSIAIVFREFGDVLFRRKAAGTGTPWNSGVWDEETSLTIAGVLQHVGAGELRLDDGYLSFLNTSGTNPNKQASQVNQIHAKNVVKAWATLELDSGGADPTFVDGYNVTDAVANGDDIDITLSGDMADTNYLVMATGMLDDNPPYKAIPVALKWSSKAVGSFSLRGTDDHGNTVDLNQQNNGGRVFFIVLGEQT